MKTRNLFSVGLAIAVLPFASGCQKQAASSAEQTSASVADVQSPEPAASDAVPEVSAAEQPASPVVSDGAFHSIQTEKPLPANLNITLPTRQIVNLANAGLDQSVMLAYITNLANPFSLGPDEIIYLNDLGVPASVVTAMLQHDRALSDQWGTFQSTSPSQNLSPQPATYPLGENPTYSAPSSPLVEASYTIPVAEPAPVEPVQDATTAPAPEDFAPPAAETTEQAFTDALSPYGAWVNVDGYGRCWQPTVAVANPDWQPYCDRGRWVYTNCGWYWLSDYSWGWAPFHYGRWFHHTSLGWCWTPDYVWAPSWVCWRYTDQYCGWAALPPGAIFRPGGGFTYLGRSVAANFSFGLSVASFTFVPIAHFSDFHPAIYAVPRAQAAPIFKQTVAQTTIVTQNHTTINQGIPVHRVDNAAHRTLPVVAVRDAGTSTPVNGRGERLESGGNTLTVFRPQLDRSEHRPSAPTHTPSQPIHQRPPAGSFADARGLDQPSAMMTAPAPVQQPLSSGTADVSGTPGMPLRPAHLTPRTGVTPSRPQSVGYPASGAYQSPPATAVQETAPPNSLVVIGRRHESAPVPAIHLVNPAPAAAQLPLQALPNTETLAPLQRTEARAVPPTRTAAAYNPSLVLNDQSQPVRAPAPQPQSVPLQYSMPARTPEPQQVYERHAPEPVRQSWSQPPEPPVTHHPEPAPVAPAHSEHVEQPHHSEPPPPAPSHQSESHQSAPASSSSSSSSGSSSGSSRGGR